MNNGGFVKDGLKANIERSGWYEIEGRIIHCSPSEIPILRELIKNGSKIGWEMKKDLKERIESDFSIQSLWDEK
jgi:hypothetical protein